MVTHQHLLLSSHYNFIACFAWVCVCTSHFSLITQSLNSTKFTQAFLLCIIPLQARHMYLKETFTQHVECCRNSRLNHMLCIKLD